MKFKGKRILIVPREGYAYPFYFLAQKWMKDNIVAALFTKPSETKFNKNISNQYSYYIFKELEGITVFDVNEIADQHTKSLYGDKIIDEAYLHYIEREYTHFQNINTQLISTQSLTRPYHFRYFWKVCTYSQQLNWLILNYKYLEHLIEEFRPDVVIHSDNEEVGRCVLREICHKKNTPNICLEYPRYETYKTTTYNLGFQIDNRFAHHYQENYAKTPAELSEEITYVEDFRKKSSIMHSMYKNDITAQYKPDGLYKDLKFFYSVLRLFVQQDIEAKNNAVKRSNPILYPSTWGYLKYFALYLMRKEYLMRKNKYFKTPIEGEKYIYMPLHLIPESTTFVLAPFYINELHIIEAVSKSLPAGWYLYVKEHQAMVGERSIEFYKRVSRLSNVKMVQMNYYTDPKPWITNSQGVVTISGTTAFEAALLGKRSVVFSDVPFSLIEGITRVHSFEELPKLFSTFSQPCDNLLSCAAYIKTVKEEGAPLDIKYLLSKTLDILLGKTTADAQLEEALATMESLFYNAYIQYPSVKNES